MSELTLREWSSILSIICIAGLLWRGIGYWMQMTVLEDILTIFMLLFLTVAAVASLSLDRSDAPASGVVPWSIGIKLVLLVHIAYWPFIIGRLGPDKAKRFRAP